jgi:hypothetical protein
MAHGLGRRPLPITERVDAWLIGIEASTTEQFSKSKYSLGKTEPIPTYS